MAIDTPKGTTVYWPSTAAPLTMKVTAISGVGQAHETIQTTNFVSTEATHTHIPSDYGEGGEVAVTVQYEPGANILTGIIGTTGVLKVDFGGSTYAITSDAIFTSFDVGAEVAGGLIESTYTFKKYGDIVYTTGA